MGAKDVADIKDVIFETSDVGSAIKAATFPFLVETSLSEFDANGPINESCTFSSVFFLTYQLFLEPGDLLSLYSDRYAMQYLPDKSKETAKKLQICQAVSYWINTHGQDFKSSQAVRMKLLEFQNTVQMDIGQKAAHLLDLRLWNVARQSMKLKLDKRSNNSLNFNEITPRVFAENITYLDWKGLSKIQFVEWMTYIKERNTQSLPLLQEQISMFNNISKWVIAMVLQKETPMARAKQFKRFIQISRDLKSLGNYNGLMAVVGGLSDSILDRMHKTKEYLSHEDKLFLKEMLELLSSDNNYSNYRAVVAKSEGFYLPIIDRQIQENSIIAGSAQKHFQGESCTLSGVIMKDLICLDVAVPDFVETKTKNFCNFKKMIQLSEILSRITELAENKPSISPKADLVSMLRVSIHPRYNEEELYELSLVREPRNETIGYRTLRKNTPKTVFADWAAGVNATPDRETVERYVDGMVKAVFKTYDKDKDGTINHEEFQSIATNFPFMDDFAMLDANGDDSISKEEMRNYFMNVSSHEMTRDFVHTFQEMKVITPVLCEYCTGYLWGLGKSASKCKECQIICHKDCKDHIVVECRQRNNTKEKTPKIKAMKKRMKILEQSYGGSTDSQLSNGVPGSPVSFTKINSVENDEVESLKHKLLRAEREQLQLQEENNQLRAELDMAKNEVNILQLKMIDNKQNSLYRFMKQMELLNTRVQTDV